MSGHCRTILLLAFSLLALQTSVLEAQISGNGYALLMREVLVTGCLNCHDSAKPQNSRGGAPVSVNYDTYTLAWTNASRGNIRVQAGTMPPASAGGALSAAKKAVFQKWIDGGKPLGQIVTFKNMLDDVLGETCLNCHSSDKSGADRNGAPATANFDTYDLAAASAIKANFVVQDGGMPPASSGLTLGAWQKALFQDWLNLDLPSGRIVTYAALNDSLFNAKCNSCHNASRSSIYFDTYDGAKTSFAAANNIIQAGNHPNSSIGITVSQKKLSFDWIYAGMQDVDTRPVCDVNTDGKAELKDVVSLLLLIRDGVYKASCDFKPDGRLGISDALSLILLLRNGGCRETALHLSAATGAPSAQSPELSREQIDWLESVRGQLGLSPAEEADFSLALYGSGDTPGLPRAFSLSQNSPNPFNPSTTISLTLPEGHSGLVRVSIYDLSGRLVRTLLNEERGPGAFSLFWDGTDSQGGKVASGAYLYRMTAEGYSRTRKMVLLK